MAFKPDRLRSVKSSDVLLEDPVPLTTAESSYSVNYTYWTELYFGRGQNIATGSPVLLHMGNGTKVPLQWGIPHRRAETSSVRLPNLNSTETEHSVQMLASRVERQWDYFATLSAYYRDGAILMRPIKGVFRQLSHENLRPIYRPIEKQKTTPLPAAKPPSRDTTSLTHDLMFQAAKASSLVSRQQCLVICVILMLAFMSF